jgi:DnaJ like chaperone protein
VFQPEPDAARNVQPAVRTRAQTTLGYEAYARGWPSATRPCPQLLEDVVDGLFHIAKSDGALTKEESGLSRTVSALFGSRR